MLIALLRGGAGKAAATANAFNIDEVPPIKMGMRGFSFHTQLYKSDESSHIVRGKR